LYDNYYFHHYGDGVTVAFVHTELFIYYL